MRARAMAQQRVAGQVKGRVAALGMLAQSWDDRHTLLN